MSYDNSNRSGVDKVRDRLRFAFDSVLKSKNAPRQDSNYDNTDENRSNNGFLGRIGYAFRAALGRPDKNK